MENHNFECKLHNKPNGQKHCPNEVGTEFHATNITFYVTVHLHAFGDGFYKWRGLHPNMDNVQDI